MYDPDLFFTSYWPEWQHVELLTLREAACLLTANDPSKYRALNRVLPGDAEAIEIALEQAIQLGRLRPFAVWGWNDYGDLCALDVATLNPHTGVSPRTTVCVEELARWADARKLTHHWQVTEGGQSDSKGLTHYPDELRAAIEAFEAVSGNPTATAKRTPKAAITAWLKSNKPELSTNARERVATVANWQPAGGAPKTPGE